MKHTLLVLRVLGGFGVLTAAGVGLSLFWQAMLPNAGLWQLAGALGTILAVPLLAALIADVRAYAKRGEG